MNIKEYKTELADSLYFGPWNECNPEKAVTLIRMAEGTGTVYLEQTMNKY